MLDNLNLEQWEVILAYGAFGGLKNVVIPYRKPSGGTLNIAEGNYNKVHSFFDRAMNVFSGIYITLTLSKMYGKADVMLISPRELMYFCIW